MLPPEFGGTNPITFEWLLDTMEAREKAGETIGGFFFPLNCDDPTGVAARGKAAAEASAAAAAAESASPPAEPDRGDEDLAI